MPFVAVRILFLSYEIVRKITVRQKLSSCLCKKLVSSQAFHNVVNQKS
jgi:hypothetical protein